MYVIDVIYIKCIKDTKWVIFNYKRNIYSVAYSSISYEILCCITNLLHKIWKRCNKEVLCLWKKRLERGQLQHRAKGVWGVTVRSFTLLLFPQKVCFWRAFLIPWCSTSLVQTVSTLTTTTTITQQPDIKKLSSPHLMIVILQNINNNEFKCTNQEHKNTSMSFCIR